MIQEEDSQGFSLLELMVVISLVAILAAIGTPAYRGYMQRAALIDLLQTVLPYKLGVELCLLEHGFAGGLGPIQCRMGEQGIPLPYQPRQGSLGYVKSVAVEATGSVSAEGEGLLKGLTVVLTPVVVQGEVIWRRQCQSSDAGLVSACQRTFRGFGDVAESRHDGSAS